MPFVSGKWYATGRNRSGPMFCSGNQLRATSKRSAPCKDRRPIVHCSCAKIASHPARALLIHGEIVCVSWFGMPLLKLYHRSVLLVDQVRSSVINVPWYPTLTLCRPVTYAAEAFHVYDPVRLSPQSCDR